ncbi:SDR family oxidoreductase [Streptomyces coelicoflavus]|uniref:SDR family oxidoreductase n=1 Tax=Streptomyces coelicoflavus TaxID=285562 RepID=UPI0024ADF09A|nr:SDR family oxidoreductase [Streptomyces coelicoflavus]MDI6520387.1 SDR family oxidoreductase [Streptomyces coelicoflavus]
MSGIKGKVVAITGASSGIGEATALLLAERGARLVLGARRSERLAELVARIERAGGTVVQIRTDVTRRDDLQALVALASECFGQLDVLVSNAGVGTISPLDDLRVEEWDHMVDVNVKGVLYGIGAALPVFRAQGTGHFVTTASTAAFRIAPTMAVYAATKFAVRALCEGLRQEAGDSLRVTTVSPGATATDFAEASTNTRVRAEITKMRDDIAIPPDAIARAIAFAIEQPDAVDVNDIVVRPTAQN